MTSLQPVTPSANFSELYPTKTVFAPRSTWDVLQMIQNQPFQVDSMTGVTVGVMGDMPLVCHKNTVTPLILDFFREAGLRPAIRTDTYETEEDAVAIARKHSEEGQKLVYVYPPPSALLDDVSFLVPVPLYTYLNDKSNIGRLVEREHQPGHRLLSVDSLDELFDFLPGREIFIKACRSGANGAGKDVYYCPDEACRKDAAQRLGLQKEALTGVRLEEAVGVDASWCLSFAIGKSGIRYLGAATQLFEQPARQTGSRIDPENLPPAFVVDIAAKIARRGSTMGYQGIAGFDIGLSPAGQAFVFDLNFRLCSSTPQVLLHEAATARVGARISQSWSRVFKASLAPALERIRHYSQEGVFVPIRLYERTQASEGQSVITGMILGKTIADIEKIKARMDAAIDDALKV